MANKFDCRSWKEILNEAWDEFKKTEKFKEIVDKLERKEAVDEVEKRIRNWKDER